MSDITLTTPRAGLAPAVRFRALLRNLWEAHRRAAARRAARRTLHHLDDYLLRDIGISRGDIEARLRGEEPGR